MICKIQHTFMGISIPSNSFIRSEDKGGFALVVDFLPLVQMMIVLIHPQYTMHLTMPVHISPCLSLGLLAGPHHFSNVNKHVNRHTQNTEYKNNKAYRIRNTFRHMGQKQLFKPPPPPLPVTFCHISFHPLCEMMSHLTTTPTPPPPFF